MNYKILAITILISMIAPLTISEENAVEKTKVSPCKYFKSVKAASEQYNISPALIAAVIHSESNFRPSVRSKVGARGLMQIMPATGRHLGLKNAFNPHQNIMAGSKYLSQLSKTFKGDIMLMAAAYNAGPGAVKKYSGIPPYKETRKYTKKVMKHYRTYSKLM